MISLPRQASPEETAARKKAADVGAQDPNYSATLSLVREGHNNKVEGEYRQVAKELSTDGNLLLRDSKLVVRYGDDGHLRQQIINAAHEGHLGISRTKARLRSMVYWPSLTRCG